MRPVDRYPYYINVGILSLHNFFSIAMGFQLLFLFGRVVEYFLLTYNHAGLTQVMHFELLGLGYDLLGFARYLSILLLPFLVLGMFINYRVLNFLFILICSVLLLGYYILILYFGTTLTALGADIFGYDAAEIKQTLGASGFLNAWYLIPVFLFIALSFWVSIRLIRVHWPAWLVLPYLLLALGYGLFVQPIVPNSLTFVKESHYLMTVNKLTYVLEKVRQVNNENTSAFYDAYYYDDDFVDNSTKYISEQFPLLHVQPDPDVLSPFFQPLQRKPNIVFIIVESLGASYSGSQADLGSFTPFLDSLANYSLSWKNFLSNGGRTFAVLPSILGSLPFAEQGFMEQGNAMPNFNSLVNILEKHGYASSFYHGGESEFDKMNIFLKKAGVDRVVDRKSFPSGYALMPPNPQGFTWGYGDREVFRLYLKQKAVSEKPSLDVFLTLSNHNPFKVQGQQPYIQKFYQLLDEYGISGELKNVYKQYEKQYSTVLYSDDAIRYFINEYKKRPDYNNTIFIITGDHRMPEIPIENSLSRFHVPFIIFSPLLNRFKQIEGVSSHLDVTPSLLAFLEAQKLISVPVQKSWIGSSFDTSGLFSAHKFIPLMRNKNELVDYLDNALYAQNGKFMNIDENLELSTNFDMTQQKIASSKFESYKKRNQKANNGNFLTPDSVLVRMRK